MVLLFVHGAGSNRDFWREQERAFPDAHFPNLPGHTASRDAYRGPCYANPRWAPALHPRIPLTAET